MNCFFVDNVSDSNGGAIGNYSSSYSYVCCPEIRNCVFYGNEAQGGDGGAIYNHDNASPFVVSCTFAENTASSGRDGLSIYNCDDSIATISNSILWNDSTTTPSQVINADDSTSVVSYSDVQGCGGSSNWDDDKLGTIDDGLIPGYEDVLDSADGCNVTFKDIKKGKRFDIESLVDVIAGCNITYADMGAYESDGTNIHYDDPRIIAMCFINESTDYANSERTYNSHLTTYSQDILPDYDYLKTGCYVPTGKGYELADIFPSTFTLPDDLPSEFNVVKEVNSTTGYNYIAYDDFMAEFNSLRGDGNPNQLIILVDNSASFGGISGLGSGYTNFINAIEDLYPRMKIDDVLIPSECWIEGFNDTLDLD